MRTWSTIVRWVGEEQCCQFNSFLSKKLTVDIWNSSFFQGKCNLSVCAGNLAIFPSNVAVLQSFIVEKIRKGGKQWIIFSHFPLDLDFATSAIFPPALNLDNLAFFLPSDIKSRNLAIFPLDIDFAKLPIWLNYLFYLAIFPLNVLTISSQFKASLSPAWQLFLALAWKYAMKKWLTKISPTDISHVRRGGESNTPFVRQRDQLQPGVQNMRLGLQFQLHRVARKPRYPINMPRNILIPLIFPTEMVLPERTDVRHRSARWRRRGLLSSELTKYLLSLRSRKGMRMTEQDVDREREGGRESERV